MFHRIIPGGRSRRRTDAEPQKGLPQSARTRRGQQRRTQARRVQPLLPATVHGIRAGRFRRGAGRSRARGARGVIAAKIDEVEGSAFASGGQRRGLPRAVARGDGMARRSHRSRLASACDVGLFVGLERRRTIVRHAQCSVLVVRGNDVSAAPEQAAGFALASRLEPLMRQRPHRRFQAVGRQREHLIAEQRRYDAGRVRIVPLGRRRRVDPERCAARLLDHPLQPGRPAGSPKAFHRYSRAEDFVRAHRSVADFRRWCDGRGR